METLDKKFSHHRWFKGNKLTRRQAIEYLACTYDFYLSKKTSKKQSNNLFDSTVYDDIITDRHCSYRLTECEKNYFIVRREFYDNLKNKVSKLYEDNKDNYDLFLEKQKELYLSIPEYKSYYSAITSR